jgi:aminopeptidase-like protein
VNNIHLVNYSAPVRGTFTLADLKKRLHWREDLPQAIPYRTSYYKRNWGFCISFEQYQRDFATLPDEAVFDVCVDTEFIKGSLSVGELVIPGDMKQEILLSTYFCHPSLANDNLSGMVLTAYLARELMRRRTRYSYRVVFVPESIGAVAYCAHNEAAMKAVDCGFVITCTAGQGQWGYKASIDEGHRINRIVEETFTEFSIPVLRYPFDPHGSDERQYASPGFRINTATITKDKYYEYKEYHSSLDTLEFISADALSRTMLLYLRALEKLEDEVFYKSLNPHCEAMLSPRGLYPSEGGGMLPGKNSGRQLDAILWLMMLCDGKTSLQDIAKRTGLPLEEVRDMAAFLAEQGLLGLLPLPEKPYAL